MSYHYIENTNNISNKNRLSNRIDSTNGSRNDLHSSRKELSNNNRDSCYIALSTNADSGLGESTTQDLSSCCSSSADSSKFTRVVRFFS